MISIEQKHSISNKLQEYCEKKGSQNKAANSLKGVSNASISQILNGNWDLISDEMWQSIAAQIGWSQNTWVTVKTRDFKYITNFLKDAQAHANVFALIGEAGSGKTHASKKYVDDNKNAFMLCCNEYWNRKFFLFELLSAMGRDGGGMTVAEMMQEAVMTLKKIKNPLIIMDEADKLKDEVLYFFITLYNQLEDHCGIVMVATDHLEKRINRGVKLNKKGYKEIFSRIGRKPIRLHGVGSTDVVQICTENGITDKADMKNIVEGCENDLRRVKRSIHATRMTKLNND